VLRYATRADGGERHWRVELSAVALRDEHAGRRAALPKLRRMRGAWARMCACGRGRGHDLQSTRGGRDRHRWGSRRSCGRRSTDERRPTRGRLPGGHIGWGRGAFERRRQRRRLADIGRECGRVGGVTPGVWVPVLRSGLRWFRPRHRVARAARSSARPCCPARIRRSASLKMPLQSPAHRACPRWLACCAGLRRPACQARSAAGKVHQWPPWGRRFARWVRAPRLRCLAPCRYAPHRPNAAPARLAVCPRRRCLSVACWSAAAPQTPARTSRVERPTTVPALRTAHPRRQATGPILHR
jgi:hypothetical protein